MPLIKMANIFLDVITKQLMNVCIELQDEMFHSLININYLYTIKLFHGAEMHINLRVTERFVLFNKNPLMAFCLNKCTIP